MPVSDALASLEEATGRWEPQVAVMAMEWSRFSQQFSASNRASRFVSELLVAAATDGGECAERSGPAALASLSPEELPAAIETRLRKHAGRILQIEPSALRDDQALGQFGLDSLMAVELRNVLESDFGIPVRLELLLSNLDLRALAAELVAEFRKRSSTPVPQLTQDVVQDAAAQLASLPQMSSAELDALLSSLLDRTEIKE
jgi:acyl carrier protein